MAVPRPAAVAVGHKSAGESANSSAPLFKGLCFTATAAEVIGGPAAIGWIMELLTAADKTSAL